MKVNVEIEEFVLVGFSHHDHRGISATMKRELVRLISTRGLRIGADATKPRVEAGAFVASAGSNARTIGIEIARSVYRELRS